MARLCIFKKSHRLIVLQHIGKVPKTELSLISGRNEVLFENKDMQFIKPKNELMQTNDGSGSVRAGVLSPRPDVIGPRDMERLASARRTLEPGSDLAPEEEPVPKEYYDNANRGLDTDLPLQPDISQLYNVYLRGRDERPATTRSGAPVTLSTTRNLKNHRMRTSSHAVYPSSHVYAPQKVLHVESTPSDALRVGYDLPFMDNNVPPEGLDLPIFGEDPAGLAAEAEPARSTDNNNPSVTITAADKPVATAFPPKFHFDKRFSRQSPPSVPNEERFQNFVKFIQANKDLVDEYIKKKRKVPNHAQEEHVEDGYPRVGHTAVTSWHVDPMKHGVPSTGGVIVAGGIADVATGKDSANLPTGRGPANLPTGKGPAYLATRRGPAPLPTERGSANLPTARGPMGREARRGTIPNVRQWHSSHTNFTRELNDGLSIISDMRHLDMVHARGPRLAHMRRKVKRIRFVFIRIYTFCSSIIHTSTSSPI